MHKKESLHLFEGRSTLTTVSSEGDWILRDAQFE